MSAKRTERLLTLVLVLMSSERGFTKQELFEEVDAYRLASTPQAREKLFDRDKAFLREEGIPVESLEEPGAEAETVRYRISSSAYRLPEVRFTAAESAALSLAARLWERAALGGPASRALRRLHDGGAAPEAASSDAFRPALRTDEPQFPDLWRAVTTRRTVAFGYRAAGWAEETERRVQPWGMGSRFGRWYLVGFDLDRQAERFFRLSRMTTPVRLLAGRPYEVPAGFSIDASLAGLDDAVEPVTAVLETRPGRGAALRLPAAEAAVDGGDGWERLTVRTGDVEALAAEVAALGTDARVVSPPELAALVRRALTRTLEAHAAEPPALRFGAARRVPQDTAQAHLARLLDLVPYVLRNQGAAVAETAARFGVSEEQLAKDLSMLFVSGPRFYPTALMDVDFESGQIYIGNADSLSQPMRLSADEAAALTVGLHALRELPGAADADAAASALRKLEDAAGEAVAAASSVSVRLAEPPSAPELLERLRAAAEDGRSVLLGYRTPGREGATERVVDPLRVHSLGDLWYLEAWCHRAQDRRSFRLDRITSVSAADPAGGAGTERPAPGSGTAGSGITGPGAAGTDAGEAGADVVVDLILAPSAAWIAVAYGAQETLELPDGRTAARIATGDTAWVPGFAARFAGEVTVAGPAEVREATLAWLRAAADAA